MHPTVAYRSIASVATWLTLIIAGYLAMPSMARGAGPPSLVNCSFRVDATKNIRLLEGREFPADGTRADYRFDDPAWYRAMESPFAIINVRDLQVYAQGRSSCEDDGPIVVRMRISALNRTDNLVIYNARITCGLYGSTAFEQTSVNFKLDTMVFDFFFGNIRDGEVGMSLPFLGAESRTPSIGTVRITRSDGAGIGSVPVGAQLVSDESRITFKVIEPDKNGDEKYSAWERASHSYVFGVTNSIAARVEASVGGSIANLPDGTAMRFNDRIYSQAIRVSTSGPLTGGGEQSANPFGVFSPGGQATSSYFTKGAHLGGCKVRLNV
jgi:hypothetical protein